jgi:broad specificity phosphatase PhoE
MAAADRPPGRLVVVRHGSTAWSRAGRHTGRTDLPLDAGGAAQARALGGRLAGHRFALVLVSPLRRARQTCALAGLADTAQVRDDLVEWDYGNYEGRTSAEIRAERPGWRLWDDGVPGGETLEEVAARAGRVVAEAREADGDVLAFAHGHLLRVTAACWLGLPAVTAGSLLLGAGALGVCGWEREVPALGRWDDDGDDPLAPG